MKVELGKRTLLLREKSLCPQELEFMELSNFISPSPSNSSKSLFSVCSHRQAFRYCYVNAHFKRNISSTKRERKILQDKQPLFNLIRPSIFLYHSLIFFKKILVSMNVIDILCKMLQFTFLFNLWGIMYHPILFWHKYLLLL